MSEKWPGRILRALKSRDEGGKYRLICQADSHTGYGGLCTYTMHVEWAMTEMQITRFTDYTLPATENDDRLHFCAFLRHPDRSTGLCLSLGRVEVELESGDVITASSHRRMLPSQDLRGHSNVILDTYLGYEGIRNRERRSASGQQPAASDPAL